MLVVIVLLFLMFGLFHAGHVYLSFALAMLLLYAVCRRS
jgi:hypothetical protein